MELTDRQKDIVIIVSLATALLLLGLIGHYILHPTIDVVDNATVAVVQRPLTTLDKCYQVASDVSNQTYIRDSTDMAMMTWNALNRKGIGAVIVYGNVSMNDESITQCDQIWVVVPTERAAIVDGIVYTDPKYLEGYRFNYPDKYREVLDAIDDMEESERDYVDSVDAYNAGYSYLAQVRVTDAQADYEAANERLIALL